MVGKPVRALVLLIALGRIAHAEDDREAARRHFGVGADLYDQGRYAEAVGEFEVADGLSHSPVFDFNIGKALDRLGKWPAAIEKYERYLSAAHPSDTEEIKTRIGELKARMTAEAPREVPLIVASAPPPLRRTLSVKSPIVLAGLGLFAAVLGAGLVGSAHADYGHLTCAPNCMSADWSGMQKREYAGAAVLGVAGALVVVDVALWIATRRRR